MEMALPTSANTHSFTDYHALGTVSAIEMDASKVCLHAGSAAVEATALAPDLFRVGLFAHGRPVSYDSEAVVAQQWDAGTVSIAREAGEVTIATSIATAHLSLDPLRVSFTDLTGRSFAVDDPDLGMGWVSPSELTSPVQLANAVGTLGT